MSEYYLEGLVYLMYFSSCYRSNFTDTDPMIVTLFFLFFISTSNILFNSSCAQVWPSLLIQTNCEFISHDWYKERGPRKHSLLFRSGHWEIYPCGITTISTSCITPWKHTHQHTGSHTQNICEPSEVKVIAIREMCFLHCGAWDDNNKASEE